MTWSRRLSTCFGAWPHWAHPSRPFMGPICLGRNHSQVYPHMRAKFGHDRSSRLAAYTWQTHTHTQNLYYIDIQYYKQCWPQYWALWDATWYLHAELESLIHLYIHIDFYSRDSCIPIYLQNLLFHNALVFYDNIMINRTKGLFQVNKNTKSPTVDLQSSVALLISSTSSKIAKDVDIFFLNTY